MKGTPDAIPEIQGNAHLQSGEKTVASCGAGSAEATDWMSFFGGPIQILTAGFLCMDQPEVT